MSYLSEKNRDSINSVDQFCKEGVYNVKINDSGFTVSKTLKAGTLDKIIDYVCYEIVDQDITDSNSISVLFTTYPSFTDSHTLYSKILQRYKKYSTPLQQASEKITTHILNLILYWFKNEKRLSSIKTLNDLKTTEFLDLQHFLTYRHWDLFKNKIFKKMKWISLDNIPQHDVNVFKPNAFFKNFNGQYSKLPSVIDFSCSKIAAAITNKDVCLLQNLNVSDCLGSLWGKRQRKTDSFISTVSPTIEHFNFICRLVILSILNCDSEGFIKREKKSSNIIEHWIKVCRELRQLRNFSSLKAVISALNSYEIYNLHKEWNLVSKNHIKEFETYSELVSNALNFNLMREALKNEGSAKCITDSHLKKIQICDKKQKACLTGTIPYLGLFLTDLITLDELFRTYDVNEFINFDKKRKEFIVLGELIFYQSTLSLYDLNYDDEFLKWAQEFVKWEGKRKNEFGGSIDSIKKAEDTNKQEDADISGKEKLKDLFKNGPESLMNFTSKSMMNLNLIKVMTQSSFDKLSCNVSFCNGLEFLPPINIKLDQYHSREDAITKLFKKMDCQRDANVDYQIYQFTDNDYFCINSASAIIYSIKNTSPINLFVSASTYSVK